MASLLHSLTTGDAEGVSASLSVLSPSTSTASTFSPSDERSIRSLVDASPSSIDARWCDVLCGAGSSRAAVSRGEFAAAYGAHTKMFGAFMGVWKDAGDDEVPSLIRAMSTVTTEHRQLARAADRAQSVDGRRPKRNFQDKSFRLLREAQKTCFRQGLRQQCLLMATSMRIAPRSASRSLPSVKELKANLSKYGRATSGLKSELEARWKKYLGEQDELTSLRAEVLALKAAQEGTAVIDLTQGEDGVPAPKRRRRDGDNGASGGGGSGSSGGMAAAALAQRTTQLVEVKKENVDLARETASLRLQIAAGKQAQADLDEITCSICEEPYGGSDARSQTMFRTPAGESCCRSGSGVCKSCANAVFARSRWSGNLTCPYCRREIVDEPAAVPAAAEAAAAEPAAAEAAATEPASGEAAAAEPAVAGQAAAAAAPWSPAGTARGSHPDLKYNMWLGCRIKRGSHRPKCERCTTTLSRRWKDDEWVCSECEKEFLSESVAFSCSSEACDFDLCSSCHGSDVFHVVEVDYTNGQVCLLRLEDGYAGQGDKPPCRGGGKEVVRVDMADFPQAGDVLESAPRTIWWERFDADGEVLDASTRRSWAEREEIVGSTFSWMSHKDGVYEFPTVSVTSHGETSVIDGELHEGGVEFKILDGSRAGETVDGGLTFNEFVNEHTVIIERSESEQVEPRVSQDAEFLFRYPTVPPLTIVEGPTRASNYNCHGTGYNGFPIKNAFWTIWATRCDQNPNDQYDMEPFKFPDNTPNGGPEDYIIVEIPARPGHPVVALEVAGLYSQANLDAPLPANFAEFDPRTREDHYSYVAEEAKEGSELRVQEVFDKGGDKRVFEDGKTLVAWGAYGTQHDFGRDQEEGWLDPQYTPALIQVSTDATIFKISLRGSNYMRGCAIFRCIQDDANPPASHAEPNRQRLHPRNFTAL